MPRRRRRQYRPIFTRNVVTVDRVNRVTKGGKRLSFRALIVVGNKVGRVGIGVASARDSYNAIQKGNTRARRQLRNILITSSFSSPHAIYGKFGAAKVLLRPNFP